MIYKDRIFPFFFFLVIIVQKIGGSCRVSSFRKELDFLSNIIILLEEIDYNLSEIIEIDTIFSYIFFFHFFCQPFSLPPS